MNKDRKASGHSNYKYTTSYDSTTAKIRISLVLHLGLAVGWADSSGNGQVFTATDDPLVWNAAQSGGGTSVL